MLELMQIVKPQKMPVPSEKYDSIIIFKNYDVWLVLVSEACILLKFYDERRNKWNFEYRFLKKQSIVRKMPI